MTVRELRCRFPRRDLEIDTLYRMYGRENEPLADALYVVGMSGTGKSALVRAALDTFGVPHAYVDLVRQCSLRSLLHSLLEQLAPLAEPRCDHLMDFLEQLPAALAGRRAALVLDRAERLRTMDPNLLPAFVRLRELSSLDISVIFISSLEFGKLTHRLHVSSPMTLRFGQYGREDVLEILSGVLGHSTPEMSEEFRRGYLTVLLGVFYRCCRDLVELRHQARRHYEAYCSPVLDGSVSERDALRLYQRLVPTLRSSLETVHMRGSAGRVTTSCDIILPFYAKYLLIAAYLASYNPAREDKRLFVKEQGRRRKTVALTKRSAKVSELLGTQLGPKHFTLDRLLAIFFCIVSERVALCSPLMSQISSLVHMQLLTAVGDHNLDGQRYKCNVDSEYIYNISKTVAHCYPERLNDYPGQLMELLQAHSTVLDGGTRLALCKALVLLRNKQLLAPTDLLSLFFQLLRCQDRPLRQFLQQHIVTDISHTNAKHKNARLNSQLQNFMYSMLRDSNQRAAKMSVDIMAELYKKNVWNDAKTVNVIASACFSKHSKVAVAALKFFLGSDEQKQGDASGDESDDDMPTLKEVSMANKVNRKSRKRDKQLEKVKKQVVKNQKKEGRAASFNVSALQLVHDPHGVAERLMRSLEQGGNKRFEVKLMVLDVVSRLIGLHELLLLNYYPYVQRFLQPHQREVTRMLQFAAQASHALVPPDVLEPLVRTLVNNFVSERNSSDAMAIGLNAVRELCARCPLAMNEELLQDLVQYRTYRDRAVMMAARSLLQLFRRARPELLRRRDRGRPTEATSELEPQQYGRVHASDHISGAEVLLQPESSSVDIGSDGDGEEASDEEWVDMPDSSDDDTGDRVADEDKQSKAELARQVVTERLLTDEDFRRIDAEQARKEVEGVRRGGKRAREEDAAGRGGGAPGALVRLADIENIHKRRRHDKATRLESVRRGQEDRDKFGYRDGRQNEHCSRTNREKRKNKNFLMLKHKARGKVKRSFKDKQVALRNHLLKQKKMK